MKVAKRADGSNDDALPAGRLIHGSLVIDGFTELSLAPPLSRQRSPRRFAEWHGTEPRIRTLWMTRQPKDMGWQLSVVRIPSTRGINNLQQSVNLTSTCLSAGLQVRSSLTN